MIPEPKATDDDAFEFEVDGGHAILRKYVATQGSDIVIPAYYDGVPVTKIAALAFKANGEVKKVTIPSTVIDLGSQAFANCSRLATISMGSGVKEIHSGCFERCISLEEVVLPDSVEQIYKSAFAGCSSLREISISEGVEVLNRFTFQGCMALTSVRLPYSLRRIATECFADCGSLTHLYYFSKTGVSDVLVTDLSLREDSLPVSLEYLGPRAFKNCSSLLRVELPYLVRKIDEGTFSGCVRLESIALHNLVRTIGSGAFKNCPALESIRLPLLCKTIAGDAFDSSIEIVASKASYASKYATEAQLRFRAVLARDVVSPSHMIPRPVDAHYEAFYEEEAVDEAVERFEVRHPSYLMKTDLASAKTVDFTPSRFSLRGHVYTRLSDHRGPVRIMLVGDLMARSKQQSAALDGDEYCFDSSFDYVRELISASDLTVGNLETMVSSSAPTTHEREFVDARSHLNSPDSFLAAIRRAGFDCVIGAQNHAYDVGTRGVFETLDNLNRYQLMHTGLFASSQDKRYLTIEIRGIKLTFVSYCDGARQPMKKANFTKVGRSTMFSLFEQEQVADDIRNARAEGAEFVLAYCHWGREYTPEVTERQRNFASWVVEAGADYILGSHSHCLQPYEVLTSSDGRSVPCLWSAGNFLSDINLQPPITRDTLIMDIVLDRDDSGAVKLKSEAYHPCRIIDPDPRIGQNYCVVPTDADVDEIYRRELQDARARIAEVIGRHLRISD